MHVIEAQPKLDTFPRTVQRLFPTAVYRQESFLLCPSCASQGELFILV